MSVIDICWKCFYYILTWLLCFTYYSFVILLYIFTIQAKIFITFTSQASYLQSRATDQLHHNTKSFQVCFFLVRMLWGLEVGFLTVQIVNIFLYPYKSKHFIKFWLFFTDKFTKLHNIIKYRSFSEMVKECCNQIVQEAPLAATNQK